MFEKMINYINHSIELWLQLKYLVITTQNFYILTHSSTYNLNDNLFDLITLQVNSRVCSCVVNNIYFHRAVKALCGLLCLLCTYMYYIYVVFSVINAVASFFITFFFFFIYCSVKILVIVFLFLCFSSNYNCFLSLVTLWHKISRVVYRQRYTGK